MSLFFLLNIFVLYIHFTKSKVGCYFGCLIPTSEIGKDFELLLHNENRRFACVPKSRLKTIKITTGGVR